MRKRNGGKKWVKLIKFFFLLKDLSYDWSELKAILVVRGDLVLKDSEKNLRALVKAATQGVNGPGNYVKLLPTIISYYL